MTTPDVYIGGRRLELVKRIGRGGEGDVFLLAGNERLAVKIYKDDKRKDREEKVRAIVKQGLADGTQLVAYPQAVVTSKSGQFLGFTMRLVEGFQEIHDLYGPKARKINFPKADFRFLVRAAANVARAVGEVHSSACVIGDLNSKGILVSTDARVALIDADSFQIAAGGKAFPCLVGVREFTPPELQARSLTGIIRTKEHDHFGLAVTIFQLLFMGRHPYDGRQQGAGDLTLDQLIALNEFAYSKARKVSLSPPGVLPTLVDFPSEIGEAFEKSFGLSPSSRPSALDWIGLLKGLEGKLNRCSADGMHFYPSAAKSCPWCRMEHATGAVLFLSPLIASAARTVGLDNFDVERAWAAIKAVVLPDPATIAPKLTAFGTAPSAEAKSAKSGTIKDKMFGLVVAGGAIALFTQAPQVWFIWIGALIFAWSLFNKNAVDAPAWRNRYSEIDGQWQERFDRWRQATGIDALVRLKSNLENSVNEYRGLGGAKAQAISRLKNERHARQLNEYLDRFMIRRASISGIGQAKTVTLASFGVETAADITQSAITRIPGFGPATAEKLLAWRATHERRFVYNPAPLPSDVQAQAKVEADFAAKASNLAKQIAGGQMELVQAANSLRSKLVHEDAGLAELARQKAQLEADLKFLGLSLPYNSATTAPRIPVRSPSSNAPSPAAGATAGGVTCPTCGSRMVRRTARRGSRRGNQFWGCSRYPTCKGTRN
ncbi:protein kinase domain-containing protein [Sphingobium sp.]|uniref:protein kinase domain-containing protein n=1 Tax=Sphingobium sp. TaxID=1912891 RepID=UPI003BB49129